MSAITALGGALVRVAPNTWQWARSGEPEPRVTDLRLRDMAPNYRCISYADGTYVEIPREWRGDVKDVDVREAIAAAIHAKGKASDIFAERAAVVLDDHRVARAGYLLPVEAWDTALSAQCGASWDTKDEPALMARATTERA